MPVDEGYTGMAAGRNIPSPDPSLLTSQQLREGLKNLKELLGSRMDGMDEATRLRLDTFHKLPAEVYERVNHLQDVHNEKFAGIDRQFVERDDRVAQSAQAAKQALDAALLAAKELVGQQNEANAALQTKAELSTIKQIDQIVVLVGTIEKAFAAQVTEIKERLDRNEGGVAGGRLARDDGRQAANIGLSILAALFGFATIVLAIYAATKR